MADILLIEDDLSFARVVNGFLHGRGYAVETCHSLKEARRLLASAPFRMVLLDYHLPDGNGFDWLLEMKRSGIMRPVIIMTSFNDVRTAVRAMREGVVDYITKPVNPDELLMRVGEILAPAAPAVPHAGEIFVKGSSPQAQNIHASIGLLAPTGMSVLIQGESGTGKENIARSIHRLSPRAEGPFVAIDCGALPDELAASELFGHVKGAFTGALQDKKGHFLEADGGTLFLDEVGNLSYATQVKLLRVLQERQVQPVGSSRSHKVDVRLIAATNDDLLQKVEAGLFRMDLYHRLNEFVIQLPPLRERTEDLGTFIAHFVAMANSELGKQVKGFAPAALEMLKAYHWPGNLRELKNVVKRSVLLSPGEWIDAGVLPREMEAAITASPAEKETRSPHDLKAMYEVNEKEMILNALKEARYNKSKAASLLNIDRKTLYLKMTRYGMMD